MEGNGLLLSVVMITYGHEKFIEQAIHGVLSQECDFDFELIVANDCSPDNTHIIIQDLIAKHPKASKIKYVRHDNNIGMMPNFLFALKSAKGKYIALCEGDDYWNLSSKVQKQVDFLEANSEFGLCHTNNSRFTQNTQKSIDDTTIKVSCIDVFSGLIKAQYPISTLTTVFHKTIWEQYIMDINPAGKDWLMGDLPFWLYLSKDYKVHYQDDITLKRWEDSRLESRKCYLVNPAPSTFSALPTDGLPENLTVKDFKRGTGFSLNINYTF